MPRRGAKVTVKFVTQNLRGLKTETRLEELFAYVQRSGVFAACVQEGAELLPFTMYESYVSCHKETYKDPQNIQC